MRDFKQFTERKSNAVAEGKPRIHLILGKQTQSHFNQGEQTQKSDISDTIDIRTKIDLDDILVDFRETIYDNFKISVGSFSSTDGLCIDYTFVGETVQMVFLISGSATMFMFDHEFGLKAKECNIFFGSETNGVAVLDKDKATFFLIDIKEEFFTRFFPKHQRFEDFKKQIQNRKPGYVTNYNLPITPKMQLLINAMIDCRRTDHFRKIHRLSKVMALLLLQLETLKLDLKPTESVSACNRAKMRIALKYLSVNYRNPMTIKELSRKIGTNEFLLKRDFKTLFGNTVFGYVAEVRMKKAKALLLKNELSVSQIADEVGYKNPQHFSTAFKRKFGMSPTQYQRPGMATGI